MTLKGWIELSTKEITTQWKTQLILIALFCRVVINFILWILNVIQPFKVEHKRLIIGMAKDRGKTLTTVSIGI